ncbi:MAG: D-alanine--D-alanine ligase [bacterium]|nr:D-alanine--D-alanine ligase [bacterium]
MKNRRIAVLMGGPSSEREISLKSGNCVLKALKEANLHVTAFDVNRELPDRLIKEKIDLVFIALHGKPGEDGTIQGMLDILNIPYTGSGVIASALSMNKIASKRLFQTAGIPTPEFRVMSKGKCHINPLENFPIVVKPSSEGSTIGISIVRKEDEFEKALKTAFHYDDNIICEKYIGGKEITVGILEEKALPVIEIIPKFGFYDFNAKYKKKSTDFVVPAELKKEKSARIKQIALKAHKILGCYGMSRVDIKLDCKLNPYVLEINTIPGLTETSLLPKAAQAAGISFIELCLRLLDLAIKKHEK